MKMYFAGYETCKKIALLKVPVLESYLTYKNKPLDLIEDIKKYKIKDFFLDSGAFTAFTQGIKINIDEYIDFIYKVKDYITVYATLDVIGSPQKTLENWLYMKKKNLDPLPVIHFGADEKYFEIYFEKFKVKYLALGGLVPYTRIEKRRILIQWLDFCFSKIKKYWPVKIHLFGVGVIEILKRYPVYSADFTGWFPYRGKRKRNGKRIVKRYVDYDGRALHNVKIINEIVKDITLLWKERGITFD